MQLGRGRIWKQGCVCDLDRDSVWGWGSGSSLCRGHSWVYVPRSGFSSWLGQSLMFDPSLRSDLCFESESKCISCPGSRVVHVANSQEFTVLRLALGWPHAWQYLWKCQDLFFLCLLWEQVTRPPGEHCTCLFGGTAAVKVRDLVAAVTSPKDVGCTQRPNASTISTQRESESMKLNSSSPVTQSDLVSLQDRTGTAHRDSASGAGPWCGSGHLGSPELCMPFTPEDWAEWGGATGRGLEGSVRANQVSGSRPQRVTAGTG